MPDSEPVAGDWRRVADAVAARIDHLKLSKAEVIRRTGVSQKTLDALLRGEPLTRRDKVRGLCDGLRWTRDSVDALLRGGDATELPEPDPEVLARLTELEERADRTERSMDLLLRAAGIEP